MDLRPVDLRWRVDSSLAGLATASGRAMRCAVSVRTVRRHWYPDRRMNWIPSASETLAVGAECTRCLEIK